MIDRLKDDWFIHVLCLFLTLFFIWGIDLVPFHPDESTQIFMSQDPFDFFKDPLSLSYSPDVELSNKMVYRAIDMPLTRYLIGFARFITNTPGLRSDWDWSLNWEQNLKIGSYPSPAVLKISRLIPTLFLPLTIYFFYFSIRKILPEMPALTAAFLFGLNPLILLHGRRAMAESALLLGISLFFWFVTRERIRPIWVGVAIAIAFNSKQTGIFLLPAGIIAVCALQNKKYNLREMLARSAGVMATLLVITVLLNPFYWRSPFSAILISIQARSELHNLQLIDHLGGFRLNIPKQALSLFSNLFILEPTASETSNYLEPLSFQIQVYKNILLHQWGRNLIGGSLQIALFISGFFVLFKRYSNYSKITKYRVNIFLITTFLFILGLFIFLPLPWQRYTLPLLPLIAFWIGYGLLPLLESLQTALTSRKTPLNRSN